MAINNGYRTAEEIKQMQAYYGTAADGQWGPNSTAAAGGLNAEQAWNNYKRAMQASTQRTTTPSAGSTYTPAATTPQPTTGAATAAVGSYDSGGLTAAQIREMQGYYGTDADGQWGPNSTAAAGGLGAKQAWDNYQNQKSANAYQDFYRQTGGEAYEAQLRKAVQNSVAQAVGGYESQIKTAEEEAAESARQAYVAKMLGQKNLDQRLSAGGYAGGMADSQRIAQEVNYQNSLSEIDRQRARTIDELQRAIVNARLTGEMEVAEQLSGYLQQVQSQYAASVAEQQTATSASKKTTSKYSDLLGAVATAKGAVSGADSATRSATYREAVEAINDALSSGQISKEEADALRRAAIPGAR